MPKLYRYLNGFGEAITQWCDSPADAWQRVCEREAPELLEDPDVYALQTAETTDEAPKLDIDEKD